MSWQERAIALRDEGKTFPEIARILLQEQGIVLHAEQIRSVYRRRKEGQRIQKQRVIFEDKRVPDAEDVAHFIEQMIAFQEARDALDTRQVDGTITLEDGYPVGIAFWADWHIGSAGVDYRLFQADCETILQTDGLYVVGCGDLKDNFIAGTPVGADFGQIIQPGMQDEVVRYYVRRTAGKWLALVAGCHDSFDKKQSDRDFIAVLAEDASALNFWHGGTLTVQLGDQSYRGHIRHRFPGESKYNPLNPARNMIEHYGEADFAVLAHRHFPAHSEYHKAGKIMHLIRAGSYKVWDDYGQQKGGYAGIPGVPVLILYPDEHRMECFADLRTGVERLQTLRGGK